MHRRCRARGLLRRTRDGVARTHAESSADARRGTAAGRDEGTSAATRTAPMSARMPASRGRYTQMRASTRSRSALCDRRRSIPRGLRSARSRRARDGTGAEYRPLTSAGPREIFSPDQKGSSTLERRPGAGSTRERSDRRETAALSRRRAASIAERAPRRLRRRPSTSLRGFLARAAGSATAEFSALRRDATIEVGGLWSCGRHN